jgi:hypothetical protein
MTIGIPKPEPPRPHLTPQQKYLLGRKCYMNLAPMFYYRPIPGFITLPRKTQREWIELALM